MRKHYLKEQNTAVSRIGTHVVAIIRRVLNHCSRCVTIELKCDVPGRLVVTHSVTFLSEVDQVIVVDKGRISEAGTLQELIDKKGDYSEFVQQYLTQEPT